MLPPVPPVRFVGPSGEASGSLEKSGLSQKVVDGVLADIRGSEACLSVYCKLELLGIKSDTILVCAELSVDNALEKFLKNMNFNMTNLKKETNQPKNDQLETDKMEIDFLIISRLVGVVLIEVKGIETCQLNKGRHLECQMGLNFKEKWFRKFLECSLGACISNLPFHKVIAFPKCDSIKGRIVCAKGSFEHLNQELCADAALFSNWWQTLYSEFNL